MLVVDVMCGLLWLFTLEIFTSALRRHPPLLRIRRLLESVVVQQAQVVISAMVFCDSRRMVVVCVCSCCRRFRRSWLFIVYCVDVLTI